MKPCHPLLKCLLLLALLTNLAHAFYNPGQGRWCSRDPIGEEGGSNLYGFAGNDGVVLIDSLGQDFIAAGSSYALGWSPGIGHLMLTYWKDSKLCIREGDRKDGNSNVSSTNWERYRQLNPYNFIGPILVSVPNDAALKSDEPDRTSVVQSGFSAWTRTYTKIFGMFTWRTTDHPDVSHINKSDGDRDADMYRVIYADKPESRDASSKWKTILQAADSYAYAEHKPFVSGERAKNWPNSHYGHLAGDGNYNNSNTFAHSMANAIGRTIPITGWEGRSHPGNITPVPVSDDGSPTPWYP